jgi:hypothetical protein
MQATSHVGQGDKAYTNAILVNPASSGWGPCPDAARKTKHQSGKSASLQTKWLCFLQLQVHTTCGAHVGQEVGEASGWLVSEISIKVVSEKSQSCGRG